MRGVFGWYGREDGGGLIAFDRWLLLTPTQVADAAKTLEDVRSGAIVPGAKSDTELWETRQGGKYWFMVEAGCVAGV